MYLGQDVRSSSEIVRERVPLRVRIPELTARAWVETTFRQLIGRAPTAGESQALTNSLRIGAMSYDQARATIVALATKERAAVGAGAAGVPSEGFWSGWTPWALGAGALALGGLWAFTRRG